jgi:hypothetical protein
MKRFLIFDFNGGGLIRDTLAARHEHEIAAVRDLDTELRHFPIRYLIADPQLMIDYNWRDSYTVFSIPHDFRDNCEDLNLNFYDDRDTLEKFGCIECAVVFSYYQVEKTEAR